MRAPSRKDFEELMNTLDAMAEVIRNHKDDPKFDCEYTEEQVLHMKRELQAQWDKFQEADKAKKAADAELKAVKKKKAAALKEVEKHVGSLKHRQN